MKYYFAPVQGHTDAAYRHFHNMCYFPADVEYTTPFIRLEKGTLRNKDFKDLSSPLNDNINLVPQIIFRDKDELQKLVTLIKENGAKRIDLNMGCPFPLQTGHKRGAATIAREDLAKDVADIINENKEISFSVKIRLGLNDPKEWHTLLPFLNTTELDHLTVHPRVAKQQYGGELNLDEFSLILNESKNPVVFNGDLKSPEDVKEIINMFPDLKGIMIGRGALARPSIFNEIQEGNEWNREKRIEVIKKFHDRLYNHYSEVLQGETQLLSKIQPFWEYSEDEIGRKAWKLINKAKTISKYRTALVNV